MIKGLSWAATAIMLCVSTVAYALDYSADAVFHESPGKTNINKIFVSNGKMRIAPVGKTAYEILDPAKQVAVFVVPDKKMAIFRDPMGPQRAVRYNVGRNPCIGLAREMEVPTCKNLGMDKVNGHVTEKWLYTLTIRGKSFVRTIWVDRSLGALVKVQSDKGTTFELLNVRFGPQPASLFVVPPSPQTKQVPTQKQAPTHK
jgi:hypothetical protein